MRVFYRENSSLTWVWLGKFLIRILWIKNAESVYTNAKGSFTSKRESESNKPFLIRLD